MKVTLIQSGTLLLTSLISFNSYALSTGDLLAINAGVQTVDPGYGSLSGISAGSWYAWDLNGDGIIDPSDQMPLLAGTAGGLQLGSTTAAGEMTAPSTFLGVDTYFYFPTTPATILSDDGAGHIELDFTGLVWDFNVASYSLAGNSAFSDTGIASLSCSSAACGHGDVFTLSYSAHNNDSRNGFGDALFVMELTGTVSSVPVPAAVWLFGSGLLGLFGITRKRKA